MALFRLDNPAPNRRNVISLPEKSSPLLIVGRRGLCVRFCRATRSDEQNCYRRVRPERWPNRPPTKKPMHTSNGATKRQTYASH